MDRRLIDRFQEDFDRHLSNDISREETFRRAKEDFERVCGFAAYKDYRSFRCARAQDIAKRRRK